VSKLKIIFLSIFLIVKSFHVFAQSSDSVVSIVNQFNFNNFYSSINKTVPDTLIENYQNYLPVETNFYSNLGNVGSATYPLLFSLNDINYPLFFKPFIIYFSSERTQFYSTHKPYTRINFVAGTSKDKGEQFLNIMHTQNVNKHFNVSFKANSHNSTGYFLKQENRNNGFKFTTNYKNNKYTQYSYLNIERYKLDENGGIQNDSYIIDSLYKPENLNVRLNSAKNVVSYREGFLAQKFSIIGKTDTIDTANIKYTSKLEIQTTTQLQWFKKRYTDVPIGNYYNNIYIDSAKTNDSIQNSNFLQNISLALTNIKNSKYNFSLGATYFQNKYYSYYSDTTFKSFAFVGNLYKINGNKINGFINFNYWFNGYLKNCKTLNSNVYYGYSHFRDSLLFAIDFLYKESPPDYFLNKFYSNNFKWENYFYNIKYSKLEFSFSDKLYNTGLALNYYSVNNYTYFDTTFLPKQALSPINIFTVLVYKNFTLSHFHLNNKIVFQQTSNSQVLPLPQFVGVHSVYYQGNLFKKVLVCQIGFDVNYFTEYYAPAYIPAICQFALQTERKTGNYPYVNVFVNFKWKRARIFFKLQHADYTLINENYFNAPHYPQTPRVLKFGISWNFYD